VTVSGRGQVRAVGAVLGLAVLLTVSPPLPATVTGASADAAVTGASADGAATGASADATGERGAHAAPAGTGTGGTAVTRPDAERATVEVTGEVDDGAAAGLEEPAAESDLEGIEAALDGLSEAMLAGEPGRMVDHLDEPHGEVGRVWRRRAANIADVELEHYRLRIDERLGDVTSEAVRARHDVDVRVVVVVEELAVAGHDRDGAARHRRTLTFVRRDDGWRLSEERDGRALGLSTPVHLWDLGPVATTGSGPVLALHHPDAPDVQRLVEETRQGIATLRDRWPAPWSERVVLLVPRDRDELDELLDADLHLDDFLSFAAATSWSEPGDQGLAGSRVVVNPERFDDLRAEVRERVLLHELLHVATRPVGSAAIPLWLEEGVAQALGERGPSTGSTARLDALGAEGRRLPLDEEFTAGGREQTHLAYLRSWAFVDHLERRHGDAAVAAFYTAVGGAASGPGTVEHHIDGAARETFGTDLDGLVSQWRSGG
jgi:hypothetical protein